MVETHWDVDKRLTELLEWKSKVTEWCVAQELARQKTKDRVDKIEEWIKNYELKREKDRRFWEILQSYSDKEIVVKGSERLTKEINELVEEEFRGK